ncbi:MAG TPA: xanthine dehydrogenase family protein subunit M [Chloroflexota bacterium]|nr:xanthine dehydrogenase family protein subunit M [Chloroflexota bacterium]
MRAFEHVDATSAEEAVELLGADPLARAIAGGTDLIPEMRLGIREPDRLINLKSIKGLDGVTAEDGCVRIGALARLAEVAQHPLVANDLSILVEAIDLAASPQIRNAATLGGSLCQESRCWYFRGPFHCWLKGGTCCDAEHGDNRYQAILGGGPCFTVQPSDPATALVALGAWATIVGPRGERSVPLEEFFTRPHDDHRALTCLGQDEVVSHVDIPPLAAGARNVFLKAMERAEFGFALASVACIVTVEHDRVKTARIVLGGVAPVPWRATAAERLLIGSRPDRPVIQRAGAAATEGARPLSTNGYKVALAQGLVRRAIETVMT